MTVWIVFRNDEIESAQLFDNEDAARYHALQIRKQPAVARIVQRVLELT
jgi:hypothetical protein